MPRRQDDAAGLASWRGKSPCPTISTRWAARKPNTCSGVKPDEDVAGHPSPAMGGWRPQSALRLEHPDTRHDYGEERVNVIGTVDGYVLHVTYTMRGQVGRIISAR